MSEKSNDSKSELYALTLAPSIPGTYSKGPTPELETLLDIRPSPRIAAEIHQLNPDGEPEILYRWDGDGWIELNPTPWDNEPSPWEHGEGAKLVLGEMGIEGDENLIMVSCKVEAMTIESKIKPQDYEQARGYQQFTPDFIVYIPIYEPGKLVNDATGNVGILGKVFRTLARQLDVDVFTVASERVDRKVAAQDAKPVRVSSHGKEVKPENQGTPL